MDVRLLSSKQTEGFVVTSMQCGSHVKYSSNHFYKLANSWLVFDELRFCVDWNYFLANSWMYCHWYVTTSFEFLMQVRKNSNLCLYFLIKCILHEYITSHVFAGCWGLWHISSNKTNCFALQGGVTFLITILFLRIMSTIFFLVS